MPTIEEVLETATPQTATAPTVEHLRGILHRRARRSRRVALLLGCVAAVVAGLGLAAGVGVGQRIESVGEEAPADDDDNAPLVTSTTPDPEVGQTTTTPAPVWARRWFLVPAEPAEIGHITSQFDLWERAQGLLTEPVLVTNDPQRPATAGLGRVSHVDGAGIFRIGSPDWDYYETTIDGRQVRIGNDPRSGRVNAFVASETGSFVVAGVDLSDEQAAELVLAAELVDGEARVTGLPRGFSEVPRPTSAPTDHRTTISWALGSADFNLRITPRSLEEQVLDLRNVEAQQILVRGTQGVYTPNAPGLEPASLVWAEEGYTFTLSGSDDRAAGDLDALIALADSLLRVDQTELIDRIGDPFMARQAETVARWLDATPPPTGWDMSTLIDGVPQGELLIASFTRQFLECAWIAEWADAIRSNDEPRRNTAETVLARRSAWPVFQAEIDARRRFDPRAAERIDHEIDNAAALADQRAAVQNLDQLEDFEREHGCGFIRPNS